MIAIGWLLWGLALALVIAWPALMRRRARNGRIVTIQIANQGLLMTVAVAAIPTLGLHPLHCAWLVPLGWLWGLYSFVSPLSVVSEGGAIYAHICSVQLQTQTSGDPLPMGRVRIEFYTPDSCGISLESHSDALRPHELSLQLFACVAVRQILSLGKSSGTSLAFGLAQTTPWILQALAEDEESPCLVRFAGSGIRGFDCGIMVREASADCLLRSHGFGVFGADVETYVPLSVMALLKHLAQADADPVYHHRLAEICVAVGNGVLGGVIDMHNQGTAARDLVNSVLDIDMDR